MPTQTIQDRASLGDLGREGLGPKFEDVFEQNLIKFEGMENVKRVVDFKSTDLAVLRTTGLSGYGFTREFNEGEAFPEDVNIKTFETQFIIRDYGKAVTVTDDMLEDRTAMAKKVGEFAHHAKSLAITKARHGMSQFNGAFGTSAVVNGATQHRYNLEQLGQTAHARADGGTAQSNRSSTNITLTELNLETQRLALLAQLTDIGLPIIDQGRIILVVPDDLEKNATIFTGSTLRPSTANNDLNFYLGIQMDVLSSRWLNSAQGGSSTAWFLVSSLPGVGNALRVYEKGGPRFKQSEPDSVTWNIRFAAKERYAVGNTEWKGIQTSDGTGS